MGTVVEVYTDAVYENLKPLRGNWHPDQPVVLGDFGTLSGEAFHQLGNVSQFGIDIGQPVTDTLGDQKNFTSGSDVSVNLTAAVQSGANAPVNAKANLTVNFGSDDSVFFNAAGCDYSMIKDKLALAQQIMTLYDADKWQRDWAVITDLVMASSVTIAVSSGENASFVIEAAGNEPRIDLADASLKLELKSQSKVGYQLVSQKPTPILIGLSKIQSIFLNFNPVFKPLSSKIMFNAGLGTKLEDSPAVVTEPREYLGFMKLT